VRGLPAVVLLPENCTLITCHFDVHKLKKSAEKEVERNLCSTTTTVE
jgi:hypothetical protein